jgi:hypothetical protein
LEKYTHGRKKAGMEIGEAMEKLAM